MKLQSFLTVFKTRKTDEEKLNEVRKHIKNGYIPYATKADVAKAIADTSYYMEYEGKKVFHVDSMAKYMLTCVSMVDLFTDLERSKANGKMLEDFDKLNSLGVFDLIVQCIDPRELKEFQMLVQMASDDIMTNEYEPHAFIKSQVDRFGTLLSVVLEPVMKGLDIDKIQAIATSIANTE